MENCLYCGVVLVRQGDVIGLSTVKEFGMTWQFQTKDHAVPASRGGIGEWNNVPSCQPCNQAKGCRTPKEWHDILEANLRSLDDVGRRRLASLKRERTSRLRGIWHDENIGIEVPAWRGGPVPPEPPEEVPRVRV